MDGATVGWENFFVAEVGAAAALTGLLFVAVSINLSRILQLQLPGRAGETLIMLLAALAVASLGLVPRTQARTFGIEVCAVWATAFVGVVRIQRADAPRRTPESHWRTRLVFCHGSLAMFLVGGISLVAGAGGGLHWLVGGTLVSFAASVMNAWVLLVEIHR